MYLITTNCLDASRVRVVRRSAWVAESGGADTASVGRVKPEWANDELQTARLALRHPVASDLEAVLRIHRTPEAVSHNPSDAIEGQAGACLLYTSDAADE